MSSESSVPRRTYTSDAGKHTGHEAAGIIVQLGSQVKSLQLGDRVCLGISISETHSGPNRHADMPSSRAAVLGCQAEYARVGHADANCFKIPDSMPAESAVMLADAASVAFEAVDDTKLHAGETAVIFGCGSLAQCVAQWCVVRGAKEVVVVDRKMSRLAWIQRALPQVKTIFSTSTDGVTVIDKLREMQPDGFNVCFNLTDQPKPSATRSRGRTGTARSTSVPGGSSSNSGRSRSTSPSSFDGFTPLAGNGATPLGVPPVYFGRGRPSSIDDALPSTGSTTLNDCIAVATVSGRICALQLSAAHGIIDFRTFCQKRLLLLGQSLIPSHKHWHKILYGKH